MSRTPEAFAFAVDVDVHPAAPSIADLMPYLGPYWQSQITTRGIEAMDLAAYPPNSPLAARADWRPAKGRPGASLDLMREQLLDRFGIRLAILNVLHGGQTAYNPDFCAALCAAINDWLRDTWLDREPRLAGSIVVPLHHPAAAVAEIERCAPDRRFVQVLLWSGSEAPLGRRENWPVFAAAVKAGLPVAIHAAHAGRQPPTSVGWPSYQIEDYAAHSLAFQAQLLGLVYQGAFREFPELKVVLLESGITWLTSFNLRADNTWRATRIEVPWVEEPPSAVLRRHVRLSLQPFDAPADGAMVEKVVGRLDVADMLLFSTDYPHWQFDGDAAVPDGFPEALRAAMGEANPRETYPRLAELLQ